jgi:hypothetical protein
MEVVLIAVMAFGWFISILAILQLWLDRKHR